MDEEEEFISHESFSDLRDKVKEREFRKGYKWRIPFLIIAIFQDMTTSGIVFGWAALLSILHDEKVYHNVCTKSDNSDVCPAQDIRLNVIFTVGSITVQLAPLLFGPVFDKFGPKISTMLSSFSIFLGSLLFAFSSPTFDAYIPGFALIGLGASAQHFAIQHISNLFPGKESTIVSIFGGCWGLSSLLFTIFLRLYISYDIKLYNLFSSYSIIAVLVFMSSSICWPMHPYTNPDRKVERINEDENASLLNKNTKKNLPKGLSYSLENKSLKEQILSFEFLYFIPFFMIGFLICNIYIGTVDDQLGKMGDSNDVYKNIYYWVNAFGWLSIPVIGWLLDKQGFVAGFAVNAICAAVFLVIISIHLLPLQVVSFALMAFFNNLLATTMYSYLAQMFGYANFGRLLAVYSTIGAATQFTQPPILALTLGPFHGQYAYTNLLLLIVWLPMFIYPIGLFRKSKKNSSNSLLLK